MKCFSKVPLLVLLPMLSACALIPTQSKFTATAPPPSTSASTVIQTPTSATDPACASLQIVRYSLQDTDGTKEQVKANNAVIHRICGV